MVAQGFGWCGARALRRWAAAGALAVGLAACGANVPNSPSVAVTPSTKLLTALGGTVALRAAWAGSGSASSYTWSSSDPAVATVDANGNVTAVAEGRATITAAANGVQGSATITVNTHVTALVAQVRYQDKEYGSNGFTGNQPYKNVRYAVAQLLDANGAVLQTKATDAGGQAIFDAEPTSNGYTVRVLAQTDSTLGPNVTVKNLNGERYAATNALTDLSAGSVSIDIPVSNGADGAFNILDVMTNGTEFVAELAGQYPPALNAYWQPGSTMGTYFCNQYYSGVCDQGAGIYLYSNYDTDEFDDDVMMHEFGHFIAANYSRDDSPGGCHYLSMNDMDLRLTWSEGWGDFFPAAIKGWLAADTQRAARLSLATGTPTSVYVDTVGGGVSVFFDLNSLGTQYIYASNELAVARLLWRTANTFGLTPLWQVVTQYVPTIGGYVNLEAFWDGWLALQNPSPTDLSTLGTIFNERSIYYNEDGYEPDDVAAARTVAFNTPETHYIYHAGGVSDVDKLAVNVVAGKTYTFVTSDLRNGADTALRLRDGGGTVVAENDDYNNSYLRQDTLCGQMRYFNDGTSLASKITYVAPASGIYTLEASSTLDVQAYPAAGRYGTYTLTVTEQ